MSCADIVAVVASSANLLVRWSFLDGCAGIIRLSKGANNGAHGTMRAVSIKYSSNLIITAFMLRYVMLVLP